MRHLLFWFLFLPILLQSQNKIGISNAVAWSNVFHSSDSVTTKYYPRYSGQLYYEYELKIGLAFKVGVIYDQSGYQVKDKINQNGKDLIIKSRSQFQALGFPIGLKYYFLKKWRYELMMVGVDFISGINLKSKSIFPDYNPDFNGYNTNTYVSDQKFNCSLRIEFAPFTYRVVFGHPFAIEIQASVYFQTSLLNRDPSWDLIGGKIHPYAIGLNFIGNFIFLKRKK